MKKWLLLGAVLAFAVGMTGVAWGHVGMDWFAVEVTPGQITIDADLSDWAWVDDAYIITSDDLPDVLGGEMPPKDDWDCALYSGWSRPPDNMLYFGVHIVDDMWNNDTPDPGNSYKDDCVEMIVDADHSGGNFREGDVHGITAQQYAFHIPGAGGTPVIYQWAQDEQQWSTLEPWWYWAYDDSDLPNATYEWKMALWDRHDPAGADASQRHMNAPDQMIGFQIQFDDVDAEPDTRDHQPGTGGTESGSSWTDATVISGLILVPGEGTAVEASSWGTVKATFR